MKRRTAGKTKTTLPQRSVVTSSDSASRVPSAPSSLSLVTAPTLFIAIIVFAWFTTLLSLSARKVYLVEYGAASPLPPTLEPFFASPLFIIVTALISIAVGFHLVRGASTGDQKHCPDYLAAGCLLAAAGPWLIDLVQHGMQSERDPHDHSLFSPGIWQPIWFSAWTGLAFGYRTLLLRETSPSVIVDRLNRLSPSAGMILLVSSSTAIALWWNAQSLWAYDVFLMGFNDFGHFMQRVSNTAAGRGFLLETPVLPPFWDHFNPGLLLIVPLWKVCGSVHFIFTLQALCLAAGCPLVAACARRMGASPAASICWGLTWLMHPSVGLMNQAFGYGWHPVTFAVPLMFLCIWCVQSGRLKTAAAVGLVACSFEEGVFVIGAAVCFVAGVLQFIAQRANREQGSEEGSMKENGSSDDSHDSRLDQRLPPFVTTLPRGGRGVSAAVWFISSLILGIAFLLVYRYSGLAEFQTGRFQALGGSPLEILSSPFTRPGVFWKLVFRTRNVIFLSGLFIPFFIPALLRGFPWLLSLTLPIGVLIVWDHVPAQSLEFHYTTLLLPIIILAAIAGSLRYAKPAADTIAFAALATSLTASTLWGAMPWSSDTWTMRISATFAAQWEDLRDPAAESHRVIHEHLRQLRSEGHAVLATGRLAAHLVGCEDVETVGQFVERRDALQALTPGVDPLLRYETIIIDRLEFFQQPSELTRRIESQARQLGFHSVWDQYEFVELRRAAEKEIDDRTTH